jgi:ribose transport system permease protein
MPRRERRQRALVGAVLGSILLSAVNSGLAYQRARQLELLATGAVILAAVALDSLIRRRRHRRIGLDL